MIFSINDNRSDYSKYVVIYDNLFIWISFLSEFISIKICIVVYNIWFHI